MDNFKAQCEWFQKYRDHEEYRGKHIFIYKDAQIIVADEDYMAGWNKAKTALDDDKNWCHFKDWREDCEITSDYRWMWDQLRQYIQNSADKSCGDPYIQDEILERMKEMENES